MGHNARIAQPLVVLLVLIVAQQSPAHARLFAPPARAADFTFETTSAPIETVAREFRARWPSPNPSTSNPDAPASGAWRVDRAAPSELFDGAALFDRARLARLYGGRSPRVARGPIIANGTVVEVVQLLSPYPEADLRRLNDGTLIMRVRIPHGAGRP